MASSSWRPTPCLVFTLLRLDPLQAFFLAPQIWLKPCQQSARNNRWRLAATRLPEDQEAWFYDDQPDAIHWLPKSTQDPPVALDETWRWCQDFVVPLNLCPWASASVTTSGAMQFYVVPSSVPTQQLESITESVAQRFVQYIENSKVDRTKVAIFFIVLTDDTRTTTSNWCNDFSSFYDWFVQLEDDWIDQQLEQAQDGSIYNLVTLAAFHPDWQFGGNEGGVLDHDEKNPYPTLTLGSALDYEKKSPYPTLTLVWTATIDMAGTEATERIAEHNEQLLGEEMTFEQVDSLYDQAVWNKGDTTNGKNVQ